MAFISRMIHKNLRFLPIGRGKRAVITTTRMHGPLSPRAPGKPPRMKYFFSCCFFFFPSFFFFRPIHMPATNGPLARRLYPSGAPAMHPSPGASLQIPATSAQKKFRFQFLPVHSLASPKGRKKREQLPRHVPARAWRQCQRRAGTSTGGQP
jgi:hypothetical protein